MRNTTAFAKTTRPTLVHSIRRDRLFARLDATPARRVAWIWGAAGTGKSTLAASYVDARGDRALWYQMDADDADLGNFFHFLAHAAARLDKGRARELKVPQASGADEIASASRSFFRGLFARSKLPTMLVLDGVPRLAASDPLAVAIEAALEEVPRHWCVLVTSRGAPPARFARLQAGGALVCIGGNELRFSAAELAEVARLRGLSLPAAALSQLEGRTGGWAAGAVLIIEHAKLAGGLAELPQDATPEVVFDFLAGEIFERFDAATRNFLLRIAVLSRVSAEVAAVLSGETHAARILRNLAHNDYFVTEVRSEEGVVYHLHPLLQEFLRSRARLTPDPLAHSRMREAASLMRSTGQTEGAVALLTECGDWNVIATLVAEQASALVAEGRSELLQTWLERLPSESIESDPRLLRAGGLAALPSRPRIARRLLERACHGFEAAGDRASMAACARDIIDAIIREFDDLSALDVWLDTAAQLFEVSAQADEKTLATLIAAALIRAPRHADLPRWIEAAERLASESAARTAGGGLSILARLARSLRGDGAVGALPQASVAHSDDAAAASPDTALASALTSALRGDLPAAFAVARAGLDRAGSEGSRAFDPCLAAIAVESALVLSNDAAARELLERLQSEPTKLRLGESAVVQWLRSDHALLDADVGLAHREAKGALATAIEAGVPALELLARLQLAQIACLAGDRHAAEASLRAAMPVAIAIGNPSLELALHMTSANVARRSGDAEKTRAALRKAFALVRIHALNYVPVLQPVSVAELCVAALEAGIEPEYARSLAHSSRLPPPTAAYRAPDWPWTLRIRTLGRFDIARDRASLQFTGKGPGRPAELLKLLIAFGGESARTEQLADALWPRVDADYAHKSFTITLHRLRRLLGEDDALVLRDGRLRLNGNLFWVDVHALNQAIDELDLLLREPLPQPDALCSALHRLADAYPGPFLADDEDQAQFVARREELRARIARVLGRLLRRPQDGIVADALEACFLRCIESDALCEAFHRGLMLFYQRHAESIEALATFERLRALLKAKLGVPPSLETQAVYDSIVAQQRSGG